MATPGLSLVGFLDQANAINHLRSGCRTKDPSDAALIAEWQAAQAKLGDPTPRAGHPDIQEIPLEGMPHVQTLIAQSGGVLPPGLSMQMVEIDPLLAFQVTVDGDHSGNRCAELSNPPTLEEMLPLALPLTQEPERYETYLGEHSMMLKARSLNVRAGPGGHFRVKVLIEERGEVVPAEFIGMQPGFGGPHAHVVRFNGRCYLHNGYHRCFGIRRAGGTHVPCLFRDVGSSAEVGINPGTFQIQLLESANPPTFAHFTSGRAWDVELREFWRFISVSWSEFAIPID